MNTRLSSLGYVTPKEGSILGLAIDQRVVLGCVSWSSPRRGARFVLWFFRLSQFMQRKVKAEEAQKQQQDKREKLEREFSSSYAKRLKADKSAKDRWVRIKQQCGVLAFHGREATACV